MYKYYLGLKYILSRKINLLGIIGVMVGVWALVLVISIFSGFIREVRSHIRGAASDMAFVAIWGGSWQEPDAPPPSYAEVERVILQDPNVVACAPRLVAYGQFIPNSNTPQRKLDSVQALDPDPLSHNIIQVVGIDPVKEATVTEFRKWLTNVKRSELRVEDAGKPFDVPDEKIRKWNGGGVPVEVRRSDPGILVGEDRFERPGLASLVVGAPVTLVVAHQKPDGKLAVITKDFALAGAFSSRHSTFDRQNVLVPIDALRSMIGYPPESEPYVDVFSEVSISLEDYGKAQETKERLQGPLGSFGLFWTWEQRNSTFLEAVNHERALMKLVLFVICVVAGFLIFATLSMMVAEKTRDIGILTAMGATRQGILAIFLLCGATIGLTGCVLGLVAGYLSSIHLNDVNQWFLRQFEVELFPTAIYKLREVPYELDPIWMAQVAGIAMGLSLLFSFIPAWRAARFDPVEALRYE